MSVLLMIDSSKVRETEIRGTGAAYGVLAEARQRFLDQIANGTATATMMLQFILLIDDCGFETIPSSVGMEWIRQNAGHFAVIVGNVDIFVETALRLVDQDETRDLDYHESARPLSHWFFQSFAGSGELMALLSPEWRVRFVREIILRFGVHNDGWIAAAIQNGVPRVVVAETIVERLRRAQVKHGSGHAISNFLQFGAPAPRDGSPVLSTLRRLGVRDNVRGGTSASMDTTAWWEAIERIVRDRMEAIANGRPVPALEYNTWACFHSHEQPTESLKWSSCFHGLDEWSVLTNHELEGALMLCAEMDPTHTVACRDKMVRLSPEVVDTIISDAMWRITSLHSIPESELKRLSLARRKRLAEALVQTTERHQHRSAAQFLFRVVTELPEGERKAFFFETVERVLKDVSAPTLYAIWRQLELSDRNVEGVLRRWLDEEGYLVGTIVACPHPKGGSQYAVPVGRFRYVEERGGHRYFPAIGDEVMFPSEGRHLTPTVVAVNFTPVMKEMRD